MELPIDIAIFPSNDAGIDTEPVLYGDRLNDLVNWQLKNNPKLKGKTKKDIASGCYISETCLKNLLSGKSANPQIGTIKRLLRYIGGGDINVLVGFAPARDYGKESETYNKTLMEGMQARLDEKRQRIEELTREVETLQADRLRLQRMYNEASKEAVSATAEVKHLEIMKTTLYSERKEHTRLRTALIVMIAVAIAALAACVYLLWDVSHAGVGLFP